MEVKVYDGNNLLWSIDRTGKVMSGTTSVEYVTNGTQQKIINILKEAMLQAESELSLSGNINFAPLQK